MILVSSHLSGLIPDNRRSADYGIGVVNLVSTLEIPIPKEGKAIIF
jgi:hypothetical protein